LSLYAIAALVGVPTADHGRLQAWADVVGGAVESAPDPARLSAAHRCLVAAGHFIRGLLAERRRSPTDDLLGALARSNPGGASLDEDGITDLVMLLLLAGHETATHLIGNGLLALLRHADQISRLRADPGLCPSAIQELLRYASPLHGVLRTATDDIMLGGRRVRRGDSVCIVLAAANRDPDVFPDPERLDTGRSATAHLAFGRGPHRCLGASLAEVTGEIGISSLFRGFPDLRLARHDAEWQGNFLFRGQRRLLVSF
jgi:pimeloyl-[acyl-carrier protein] synthase